MCRFDMRFVLRDRQVLGRCMAYIADLPESPVMEVVIQPHKTSRSLAQNDLFHALVREIAQETGHSFSEMKDMIKFQYLGTRKFTHKGQEVEVLRETSSLNVEEMHELLEDVVGLAGRLGIGLRADPELVKEAGFR